jgi:hypothetical protein
MKWSLVFKIAALWNFSGALFALCFKDTMSENFFTNYVAGTSSFESNLNYYLLYSFIMIMGIGYWLVSVDLYKNKAILIVGILGKIVASLTWITIFFMNLGTILLLVGAFGDFLWAMLFIFFLRTYKKHGH